MGYTILWKELFADRGACFVTRQHPSERPISLGREERGMTVSKNLDISVLFDYYGNMLTEKQRNVIDLYYNQDLSLAEIAEHEKITRQGVRDNIKRGEAYMLELEEALHTAAQSQKLIAMLEEIKARNREIALINDNHKYSSVIRDNTNQIAEQIDTFLENYD